MIKVFAIFVIAYLTSWVAHGKLISRLRTTHRYMKLSGFSFRRAWELAGRVI